MEGTEFFENINFQKNMLQELIQGCRQKNPAQQRELFRRFAPTMMTVARRYAQSKAEAEDILQDSFVKVFRSFDQFEGERGSLEGWIRRIVVNTSIQNWRKYHKNYHILPEEAMPNTPVAAESDLELDAEEILKMIEKLAPGFKMVFNLYALEGYSHAEIGEMLGIAESASRSQLARARKQLQDAVLNSNKAHGLFERLSFAA